MGFYFVPNRFPAAIPKRQIELDLGRVQPIQLKSELSAESTELIIPKDMQATSDERVVGNQVLDHGFKSLMQGKFLKNSPVIQSAQKVQQALQPKVGYTDASGVSHSLNLEVEAFQGFAKVKYEGYLSSNLIFYPKTDDFEWSVSEELTDSSDLILEHDTRSEVSWLKISFGW